jgi:hypothetical protein
MCIPSVKPMPVPSIKATTHTYTDADSEKSCSICLEDFKKDESLLGHASHNFHPNCLNTALKIKNSCPLCNQSLFSDEAPLRIELPRPAVPRREDRYALLWLHPRRTISNEDRILAEIPGVIRRWGNLYHQERNHHDRTRAVENLVGRIREVVVLAQRTMFQTKFILSWVIANECARQINQKRLPN